jgi:hypothetical protein
MPNQDVNIPTITNQNAEPEGSCPVSPGNSDDSATANSSNEVTLMPTITITAEPKLRKNRSGQFAKGTTGNPAGRPRGSRNKATLVMETLLEGEAGQLIRKAIEIGMAGNVNAIRLCLERVYPPLKDRPIHLDLPPVETLPQISSAISKVFMSIGEGNITPSEGETLANILAVQTNVVTTGDLDRRMTTLEEGMSAYKNTQVGQGATDPTQQLREDRTLQVVERDVA